MAHARVMPRLAAVAAATLSLAAVPMAAPAADPAQDQAGPPSAQVKEEVDRRVKEERAADIARRERIKKRARLLPHYEYLEDSYVNYAAPNVGPVGDRPLAFEAQAATHLFLKNNWDVVEATSPPGHMANVVSVDVSFVLHLRMVQDHSAPVRPPSYMPGMHVQWFGLWKVDSQHVRELEAEVGFTHHSNGQQGCTFTPDGKPADTGCLKAPAPGTPVKDQLNFRSGDFSTSFAQLGVHYAFMTLDLPDRYLRTRGSIGVIWLPQFVDRPGNWAPGAISRDQAGLYGIHRIRLEGQLRMHITAEEGFLPGTASLTLSHERMWNTALGVPNHRWIGEASYALDEYHGLGAFVRGTSGQDDLNVLYLAGPVNVIQLGIMWNTAQAVRYRFGEGEIPGD